MKKKLFTLFFFGFLNCLHSQNVNFYVKAKTLNLRSEADKKSEVIETLSRYDNLKVLKVESNWAKVSFKGIKGYVFKKYIKKGKAEVVKYSYRTGAKCKDGTYSSATGRGACSHHGGVAYWLHEDKSSVNITNE